MNKFYSLIVAALLVVVPAAADHYRPIHERELPRAARELLAQHFADLPVAYIAVDRDLFDREYKVVLDNGTSLEFDKNGRWKEIDGKRSPLPEALIPEEILRSVSARFEGRAVQKIERDRHGYEVLLEGGIDLEYTHRFRLIEVDD